MGGPKTLSQLYSLAVAEDFQKSTLLHLSEEEVQLNEGRYHHGRAQVIRLFASKHS